MEDLREGMKQAMRQLCATVSVVTSFDGKVRYAMTATAVSSLSLDPPAILVCINRDTGLHGVLSAGHDFCLNALHKGQENISENCAWKLSGEDRFSEGNWEATKEGLPYLSDAQATVMCSIDGMMGYGSHTIFIGKVRNVNVSKDTAPLIFFDGKYTSL